MLISFSESSKGGQSPHQKKIYDRHKTNDKKDQNSEEKLPSVEQYVKKLICQSQGRLSFESNDNVSSNEMTIKKIGEKVDGKSDDITQKSPKSDIRNMLGEINEGTSVAGDQWTTRKHHIGNDVNEMSSGKKKMLDVVSESTSNNNNNIQKLDHIDASQGCSLSEDVSGVLLGRTNNTSILKTGPSNLYTIHTASSLGDSASVNKESGFDQDIPIERGVSKEEVINCSKEIHEGQETSFISGVNKENTVHDVNLIDSLQNVIKVILSFLVVLAFM